MRIRQGRNQPQPLQGVPPFPRAAFASQVSLIPRRYEKGFQFAAHHSPVALRALHPGQLSSDASQPPPKSTPWTPDPLGLDCLLSRRTTPQSGFSFHVAHGNFSFSFPFHYTSPSIRVFSEQDGGFLHLFSLPSSLEISKLP